VDALGKPFPITHGSQLQDNPSLGLPLQVGSCESCGATQIDKCEGHFGFIELPAPIYHPSHVTELGKILNIICLCCLRLKKPNVRTTAKNPAAGTEIILVSVTNMISQLFFLTFSTEGHWEGKEIHFMFLLSGNF